MPQAFLKVALVHLAGAVPAEGHQWLALPPRGRACPMSLSYHQAKGHLLTDAIAAHAAFPPVALVTVKLILGGLGHQADAKAASVGGQGGKSALGTQPWPKTPVTAPPCPGVSLLFQGVFSDDGENLRGAEPHLVP